MKCLSGCLVAILITGNSVCAEQIQPKEAAKWHEKQAVAAADSGDIETAVGEFKKAFGLVPDGIYLYNIAFLLDGRGESTGCRDRKSAGDYYRQFLDEVVANPGTYVGRPDVHKKVQLSKGRILEIETKCGPAVAPVRPVVSPSPYRGAGVGALIAGGAAAGVGAILLWHGTLVRDTTSTLQPTEDAFWNSVNAGRQERVAGAVLLGAGAAVVVAGTALLLLPKRRERTANWLITPTTQGILVTGVF